MRTLFILSNLPDESPTHMLVNPGATPHWGTTAQPFFTALRCKSSGFLGVYEMSTMSFPSSTACSRSSNPIRPGSAPHKTSASPISRLMSAFWPRLALTVLSFGTFFTRFRLLVIASATTISENSFAEARSLAISDPTFPHPTTSAFMRIYQQFVNRNHFLSSNVGLNQENRDLILSAATRGNS